MLDVSLCSSLHFIIQYTIFFMYLVLGKGQNHESFQILYLFANIIHTKPL